MDLFQVHRIAILSILQMAKVFVPILALVFLSIVLQHVLTKA